MFISDTYTSLLETYQQATDRGENALLTLETNHCVETVKLCVSRPAGGPAAWRERACWRTPASPHSGWRTPARQGPGRVRRSPGTGASGWAPPTPLPSGRRKSPSQLKRDANRSEVRKLVWSKEQLEIEPSELVTKE